MNLGIETIVTNIGIPFEYLIVLIGVFGGIIFYAKDFRIGLLMTVIINAGIFIWFVQADYNYAIPLIIMLIGIVILSFSLYAVSKNVTNPRGGFV